MSQLGLLLLGLHCSLFTFQTILEEIVPRVMDHKNAKVREGILLCISETLQKYLIFNFLFFKFLVRFDR